MDVKRSHFAKYSCFGGIFVTKDIFQCLNLLQRKLQPHSPGGAKSRGTPGYNGTPGYSVLHHMLKTVYIRCQQHKGDP